jgi:hypothetical protein
MKTGFWRFVHPLKRRWYLVWVTQDLFGEQVLVLRWGSLDRKLGVSSGQAILRESGKADRPPACAVLGQA